VKDRKAKGRRLARGHDKARRPVTKKATPKVARSSSRSGTRVLGLRVANGPTDVAVTDGAAPGLFPRPAGETLPFTGGDIAAMLFIGLMVITIGGLIWRAPSLIDKPRRSRDLSI
jgi:hypothetical protein